MKIESGGILSDARLPYQCIYGRNMEARTLDQEGVRDPRIIEDTLECYDYMPIRRY